MDIRSLRGFADFSKRHKAEIANSFNLPIARTPSYSTIRRVLMGIEMKNFIVEFNNWMSTHQNDSQFKWIALDGKSLKNTVTNSNNNFQNFVQFVSAFNTQTGLIVGLDRFENKYDSEIKVVRELIKLLGENNSVITLDALHCNDKTLRLISSLSNDFLIKAKRNNPNLYEEIKHITITQEPESRHSSSEVTRNRATTREVLVFPAPKFLSDMRKIYLTLFRLIVVELEMISLIIANLIILLA